MIEITMCSVKGYSWVCSKKNCRHLKFEKLFLGKTKNHKLSKFDVSQAAKNLAKNCLKKDCITTHSFPLKIAISRNGQNLGSYEVHRTAYYMYDTKEIEGE